MNPPPSHIERGSKMPFLHEDSRLGAGGDVWSGQSNPPPNHQGRWVQEGSAGGGGYASSLRLCIQSVMAVHLKHKNNRLFTAFDIHMPTYESACWKAYFISRRCIGVAHTRDSAVA